MACGRPALDIDWAVCRLFVRGENLGNVRYTDGVQVNDASGFFYYPAPGRHAQAGLEVRW
jgi:hypothetical protein